MRVVFKSGEIELEGVLSPKGSKHGVVLCHPHPLYGGSMENGVILALEDALKKSTSVLRFNFRGVGRSKGSFSNGVGEREDVRAAVELITAKGVTDVTVIGYSFGSWVAFSACYSDRRVRALAGISPPITMFDFEFLKGCTKPKLFVVGTADLFVPRVKFLKFYEELAEPKKYDAVEGANHFWFGYEREAAEKVAEWLSKSSSS